MKKTISIFIIIITSLVTVSVNAQNYIGITGGFSSVSGNFSKTDYSDLKSGFASSGGNIGITGVYFFSKHFGINALVSYQGYGFKGVQNLADGYKEDFDIDSSTIYIKKNNYTLNFFVGPYYSFPITDNFSIDLRVLLGLTNAHLAGNEVYLEDQADGTFSQKAAAATTLGLQGGAAMKYHLTRHLGLMVNADYYYTKPDFSITNINRYNNAGREINTYNQAISGINLNLSVVYLF